MEDNVNKFKTLLLEENKHQNLVSRKSINEELGKHVEDSLKITDFVCLENREIVDIGTGAGFPGLLLAINIPEAKFTLVESDLKKSTFLHKAKTELGLNTVRIVRRRVEELGQDEMYREKFDICTSRAVAAMNIILEYGLPLLKKGGLLMLWKGRNYQQEIDTAGEALKILGGQVADIYPYNLLEERDRVIVAVEKVGTTPARYPRRVGIPSKRPL